ncbi:MAG: hypothetical protein KKC85_09465 [Gammaproteobacteria bacterium]|nr:hypothetical protein [Gammaproteobacteria bacterium]MBU2286650.1 hypothetical protein [Gammaproteobacteria bacterium]
MAQVEIHESGRITGNIELIREGHITLVRLWPTGAAFKPPPLAMLYRPTLTAIYSGTLTLSGEERGPAGSWVFQKWHCRVATG